MVWVRALRRCGKEVGLARVGVGVVYEGAQTGGEDGDVLRRGFEVEVEAVDGGGAEGAEGGGGGGGGRRGAEYGPEGVCLGEGLGGGGEAAFGVGCAAEGEEEGLPGGLAGFDVGFDLRAGEELGAREDGAVVAGVGEVDERGRFDADEEGDGDDVHGGVCLFC